VDWVGVMVGRKVARMKWGKNVAMGDILFGGKRCGGAGVTVSMGAGNHPE